MTPPKRESRFATILKARQEAPADLPEQEEAAAPSGQAVMQLVVTSIRPNRDQPRKLFNEEELDQLAGAIRQHGLLQPIVVRPIPPEEMDGHRREYEIIVGERRWRAVQRAGLTAIAAIVNDQATTDEVFELALIENIQRADLNPLEEGRAFVALKELKGLRYEDVAARFHVSIGYVQNRIRATQVAEDLQQLVLERPDTLSHIYYLDKVTEPAARAQLIADVREQLLSLAETQRRVEAAVRGQEIATAGEVAVEGGEGTAVARAEGRGYLRKYHPDLPPASPALSRTIKKVDAGFLSLQKDVDQLSAEDRESLLAYLQRLTETMEQLVERLSDNPDERDV